MTQTKTRRAQPIRKQARTKETRVTQESGVLTLDEAAVYLRVPPQEVLRSVAAQNLPGRQFGNEWRFLKTALQAWLGGPAKKPGLLAQLGKAKDDPYFQEMLDEIYARRGRPEVEAAAG
jgi:excisionase family DNA binding protein